MGLISVTCDSSEQGVLMKIDWNRGWTFSKEGGQATKVTLPHDAMLGEKRDGSCRNGVNSGYFPGGKYILQ